MTINKSGCARFNERFPVAFLNIITSTGMTCNEIASQLKINKIRLSNLIYHRPKAEKSNGCKVRLKMDNKEFELIRKFCVEHGLEDTYKQQQLKKGD